MNLLSETPAMRSSKLRGDVTVFPDVLSTRSRSTGRQAFAPICRNLALLLPLALLGCSAGEAPSRSALERWLDEHAHVSCYAIPGVAVAATLVGSSSEPTLRFRLVNTSNLALQVDTSELPWGNAESVRLIAFSAAGDALERSYLLDGSLFPEPVVIPPGGVLEGELIISASFVGDWPKPHHTLLLWSYRLPRQPGHPPAVATGQMVIPASDDGG